MSTHQSRKLITFLYWIVAAEFFLGAVTKYWPGTGPFGQDYAEKFANWGYPASFRFVVGAIELVCAVLLVIPDRRSRFLVATGLVFVLTGAMTTHIINDDLLVSLTAPIHLVIAAVIALANWPASWREVIWFRRISASSN